MQQQPLPPLHPGGDDDRLNADDAVELIQAISTRSVGRAARAIFNNGKLRSLLGSLFAAKFVEVSLCDSLVGSSGAAFDPHSGQQREPPHESGSVQATVSTPPSGTTQPQAPPQSVLRGATVRTLLQQMRRKQRHPQTTSRMQAAAAASVPVGATSVPATAAAAWSAESDGDDEMPHSASGLGYFGASSPGGRGGGGGCGSSSSDAAEVASRNPSATVSARRRVVAAVADAASSTAKEPKLRALETVSPLLLRQTSAVAADDRQPPESPLYRGRMERRVAAEADGSTHTLSQHDVVDLHAEARSPDDAVVAAPWLPPPVACGQLGQPLTSVHAPATGAITASGTAGSVRDLLVAAGDGWLLSPGQGASRQLQQQPLHVPSASGFFVRTGAIGLPAAEAPADGDVTARLTSASAGAAAVLTTPPAAAAAISAALVCELCGRRFSKQSALMQHRRWHTGEKPAQPYRCELCGRGFSSRNSLHIHGAIHSGEKRYACEVCNKRFSTQTYLWHHRAVHSDARPYSCEFCACDFKMRSSLNNHLARRHAVFSSPSARGDCAGGGSPGGAADASTATASDCSAVGDQPLEKQEAPSPPPPIDEAA